MGFIHIERVERRRHEHYNYASDRYITYSSHCSSQYGKYHPSVLILKKRTLGETMMNDRNKRICSTKFNHNNVLNVRDISTQFLLMRHNIQLLHLEKHSDLNIIRVYKAFNEQASNSFSKFFPSTSTWYLQK